MSFRTRIGRNRTRRIIGENRQAPEARLRGIERIRCRFMVITMPRWIVRTTLRAIAVLAIVALLGGCMQIIASGFEAEGNRRKTESEAPVLNRPFFAQRPVTIWGPFAAPLTLAEREKLFQRYFSAMQQVYPSVQAAPWQDAGWHWTQPGTLFTLNFFFQSATFGSETVFCNLVVEASSGIRLSIIRSSAVTVRTNKMEAAMIALDEVIAKAISLAH
jgi:hypothetical protein